jgi:magnesium transporter
MSHAVPTGVSLLARRYLREHPRAAATHLETAAPREVLPLLDAEPGAHASAVADEMTSRAVADLLEEAPSDLRRRIAGSMDPGRLAAALGWFDDEQRQDALRLLDGQAAREIQAILDYPPDTAGRLMEARVTTLRRGTTVAGALARVRRVRNRHVSDVFLVDDDGRLAGRVPLQELAVAPPAEHLDALAVAAVSMPATASQQDVVDLLSERRLASLPVVDFEGRPVGVIRHDGMMRAAQQDVTADIQTMVGASRQERALSRVSFAVRRRLPWLEVNLAAAFLAASIVGLFESTIAQFTALAVLMPVVAGQSGNTGAQALAVTMRGLALREIRVAQWFRVARKEAAVAFINGWVIALTTAAGVFLWSSSPGLSFVVGIAMLMAMVAAGIAGVIIPMTLTSLGQDPAQSSSIFLTTVTDVVGFSSFLGIATLLSSML